MPKILDKERKIISGELHLVLLTLHVQFSFSIEQDKMDLVTPNTIISVGLVDIVFGINTRYRCLQRFLLTQ